MDINHYEPTAPSIIDSESTLIKQEIPPLLPPRPHSDTSNNILPTSEQTQYDPILEPKLDKTTAPLVIDYDPSPTEKVKPHRIRRGPVSQAFYNGIPKNEPFQPAPSPILDSAPMAPTVAQQLHHRTQSTPMAATTTQQGQSRKASIPGEPKPLNTIQLNQRRRFSTAHPLILQPTHAVPRSVTMADIQAPSIPRKTRQNSVDMGMASPNYTPYAPPKSQKAALMQGLKSAQPLLVEAVSRASNRASHPSSSINTPPMTRPPTPEYSNSRTITPDVSATPPLSRSTSYASFDTALTTPMETQTVSSDKPQITTPTITFTPSTATLIPPKHLTIPIRIRFNPYASIKLSKNQSASASSCKLPTTTYSLGQFVFTVHVPAESGVDLSLLAHNIEDRLAAHLKAYGRSFADEMYQVSAIQGRARNGNKKAKDMAPEVLAGEEGTVQILQTMDFEKWVRGLDVVVFGKKVYRPRCCGKCGGKFCC
ncbi:hypothetical protein GLAREA_03456 [Glarea lozoyensis ATCC 20868]|uniref:Uncharacterized protein n=1 Tax=Glarea lozoyensis (strain ATCC 20868 / MF5171) TaxID=1116229 RepID=S3D004_GLAL2|nr:uncharacterized protein GLAREA_03456 [Glarea lozoyensis ATCC 20868]EPE30489.1 hypothetical protein GLAREA_03456 [Glarea lozoyensis ATCC 20868]